MSHTFQTPRRRRMTLPIGDIMEKLSEDAWDILCDVFADYLEDMAEWIDELSIQQKDEYNTLIIEIQEKIKQISPNGNDVLG